MEKKAIISKDKIYRYKLSRTWDSTKPTILFIGLNPSIADENIDDPIGKDNDHYLLECVTQSDLIVACWGNNGTYMNREKVIKELVPNLYCLQKNKNGTPHHPLRPPRNIHPLPFNF